MPDLDLLWRAEEACTNAWPARRHALLGGWLLRQSGGRFRRPNSVTPLREARSDPKRVVATAETLYRAHGQSPIFRILSFADEMDGLLDETAYPREGRSLAIAGDLEATSSAEGGATLSAAPEHAWLEARHRLTDDEGTVDAAIFEDMLRAILFPTAFASAVADGQIASLAYGVVQNRLLVVESVVTDPRHRGRGLARSTLTALFAWGKELGADTACLQVIADNEAALRLYRGLGLTRDLFAYHYRRGASPQAPVN